MLDIFWQNIDPLDAEGQFADKGEQYQTAIFYNSDEEKKLAEILKIEKQKQFTKPIATKILPAGKFYPAEEYHQDFYKKRTVQYQLYKKGSGRDRLKEIWEK